MRTDDLIDLFSIDPATGRAKESDEGKIDYLNDLEIQEYQENEENQEELNKDLQVDQSEAEYKANGKFYNLIIS